MASETKSLKTLLDSGKYARKDVKIAAKITAAYLCQLESGARIPSLSVAVKICGAVGNEMNPQDFLPENATNVRKISASQP